VSALTARQLAWRLGRLVGACPPGLPVGELLPGHLFDWQALIGAQRPASRRAQLSTARRFCAWAVAEGLLEHDPTVRLQRVREPHRPPRALSAAQVSRLMLVLPTVRADTIVLLMVRLGLRCVEVARLQLSDWDRDREELHVVGKADNERDLPVPPDVDIVLRRHTRHRIAGPLFDGSAHLISREVAEWMERAGIKTGPYDGISAHALRHTAASNMLDRCGNVRTVQAFLGHTSLATTQRYLRKPSLDAIRAALGDTG
jgi:integrase/recombinase XerC